MPSATRLRIAAHRSDAATRIEPGGRLVEQEELRATDQAGTEVEPATHAPGVGAHEAVAGVGEVQALEHLRRRDAACRADSSPNSRATMRRFSIPVIAGSTDAYWPARPMTSRTRFGLGGGVDAGDADLAAVGTQQRGDRAHECGLAGAVRPEQRGDLAGFGDEVEAVECVDVAEALRHARALR